MTTSVDSPLVSHVSQVSHQQQPSESLNPLNLQGGSHSPPLQSSHVQEMSKPASKHWQTLREAFQGGKMMAITPNNLKADMGKTYNLTPLQRQHYAVQAQGGKIMQGKGTFSTDKNVSHDKAGFAAFVLSTDNQLYAFNHLNKSDGIAHSSFAGKFAKGAGEMQVEDGKVSLLHAHSGHFRPNALNMHSTLQHLDEQGVLKEGAKVSFVTDPFAGLKGDYGDLPVKQAKVQAPRVLDEDDQLQLKNQQEKLATSRDTLEALNAHLESSESVALYKQSRIDEISLDLQFHGIDVPKDPDAQLYHKKMGDDLRKDLEKWQGMDESGVRKELGKGIRNAKDEIEETEDLIVQMQKHETLEHVYDARQFMAFVDEHHAELSKELSPGFLKF